MNRASNNLFRRFQIFASLAALPDPNGQSIEIGDRAYAIAEDEMCTVAGDGIGPHVWRLDSSGAPPPVTPDLSTVLAQGNKTLAHSILVQLGQRIDTDGAGVLGLGTASATAIEMGNPLATLGTFQLFINQGGLPFNSNAGIQYSTTVANRAQFRGNQFGANNAGAGITSFKSRGATTGVMAGCADGDILGSWTVIGVGTDNASIPLAATLQIRVPAGGAQPGYLSTEFSLALVPPEGPTNGKKEMFNVNANGHPALRETANRAAGVVTLDAGGTATILNNGVTANTRFLLTYQDITPSVPPDGVPYVVSRVVSANFKIASASGALDAGQKIYYQLWEPTPA